MYLLLIAFISLFVLELLYFKIADHFNIIDHPNERSSHSKVTLRGGGIIFPIAALLAIAIWQQDLLYLGIGLLAIATISFLDDIHTLSSKLRMAIHLIAVSLLLYQILMITLNASFTILHSLLTTQYALLIIPFAFLFIIGIINAYNFMDGINGITVAYSIVTLGSLWGIQYLNKVSLLQNPIWELLLAALGVFAFFNFRKKAKAFAGDVGSISMAFIICFLLAKLMLTTADLKWILLLGIYGLDAVATICFRVVRKENIFDAHCSHFYQYLANEQKWNHLIIALIYAGIQLSLNAVLVYSQGLLLPSVFFGGTCFIYFILRWRLEGKRRLFNDYKLIY